MRTGKNPAKAGIPAYQPQMLGVALIVYIPFSEGYFEHSLEILHYQIESLQAATPGKYDLLLFDNGSCPEAVAQLKQLHDQNRIDWLVLSRHNLGKAGAWNWIFSAMPNQLICYADSDVLFRPGWLESSLKIMEAFPQAGMVAAQPNFFDVMQGEGKAHLSLRDDPQYELEDYWPEKAVIDEYCFGIGADADLAAPFYANPLPSILRRESRVRAVIGASHMQFLTRREVARQLVPLPATKGLLRAETMSLDYKMDTLGYLHLSTLKPHVFHMGNTVNDRLLKELSQILKDAPGVQAQQLKGPRPKTGLQRLTARLARNPRLNRFFLRVYNLLFQALYSEG
jgi:glycosyltransferase involved in cell wall biosynthesis